jgi:hypothetical protein
MLELPWKLTEKMLKDVKMQLPDHCGFYMERPSPNEPRDELGRMKNRKPLKLWYPNQEPEAEAGPCPCWHCKTGKEYGDECFYAKYSDKYPERSYTWKAPR